MGLVVLDQFMIDLRASLWVEGIEGKALLQKNPGLVASCIATTLRAVTTSKLILYGRHFVDQTMYHDHRLD